MTEKHVYVYNDFFLGQEFPSQKGQADHSQFDITNPCSILFVTLDKPTNYELEQFASKQKVIRMTQFPGCIWMTFKFGELEWMDAPYSPHLSKQADFPGAIHSGGCSSISLAVVDSSDGKVKYCERLSFSEEFATSLKESVSLLLAQPFNKDRYDYLLEDVQSQLEPTQIAEKSWIECVLRSI